MLNNKYILNWVLLITLVIIWGASFVAIKVAITDIGPAWVAAFRLAIATFLMIIFAKATHIRAPKGKTEWGIALVFGIIGTALPFALISWASQYVPSGIAGLMMATNPMLVLILAIVILPEEPPTPTRILGLIIGFIGVTLVITGKTPQLETLSSSNDFDFSLLAYIALLLGALGYAINTVISRRVTHMPHATRGYGALLTATPAAILLASLTEQFPQITTLQMPSIIAILYLAILPTWIATLLLYRLIAQSSAGFVAQSNYLVPAAAILFGAILLSEVLTIQQYLGFGTILLGIAIAEKILMQKKH